MDVSQINNIIKTLKMNKIIITIVLYLLSVNCIAQDNISRGLPISTANNFPTNGATNEAMFIGDFGNDVTDTNPLDTPLPIDQYTLLLALSGVLLVFL